MKRQYEHEHNLSSTVTHECVTTESSGIERTTNPQPVANTTRGGSNLVHGGLGFSVRALQLFEKGHNTIEIAEIMDAEWQRLPGHRKTITEARVYNALAKVRTELFEQGIKLPLRIVG